MSLLKNINNYINFATSTAPADATEVKRPGMYWNKETQSYDMHNISETPKQDKPEPKKTEENKNSNKKEFDYTYGGKFNTREVLQENESYRDTVYTNHLGKNKDGSDRFDLPTIGRGQTLRWALANDNVTLTDKDGNKVTKTGKEWHDYLTKDRDKLPQGSGKNKGKSYSGSDPLLYKISEDDREQLEQKVNERYLLSAKRAADEYAKVHGDKYAWDNLSPYDQMQVFQSNYGGKFSGNQTTSGKSINKSNMYLDMKRSGINPDTTDEDTINKFFDKWYKDNVHSPGSNSRDITGRRFWTTHKYHKRKCEQ